MDDLDRLFNRLVQNIRGKNPAQLNLPFTVAELFDQLVPYRHNRRELGIETNQDYEIAVTRLLAGERGYLLGDSAMQDTLRKELERRDPDTGAFREFSTAEVTVAPEALKQLGGTDERAAAREPKPEPEPEPETEVKAEPAKSADIPKPRASASSKREPAAILLDDFAVPEGCRFCGATLPEDRDVKFCPSCGQNLTIARCPACGGEVEAGWKFCVGCGRPTGN